jgi:RNA polymerase sigma-70 factor (ECF subfamily)
LHQEDIEAIEALHARSFGWALACCRSDRQEAEDVLQETYLAVLEDRARFDGRSSLKTWLFGVIWRVAAGRRRARWIRTRALVRRFGGRPEPDPADPHALVQEQESTRSLRRALAALPRRQREVLHLHLYQDLTIEESATVLGISLGSARTHYHRGKERLRAALGTGRL